MGRERYFEALSHAASVFPSGTVVSGLVAGVEPAQETIAGIDHLTSLGVLPVLSVFRPLEGTALGNHEPPSPKVLAPLYAHLYRAVKEHGITMSWVRDLALATTPLEARYFAGEDAPWSVAWEQFSRSRLGGRAARGLLAMRRRLRVKAIQDSYSSSGL